MNRRTALTWLVPLSGTLAASAQTARSRPLIGRLTEGGPGNYTVFRNAMRDLGHADVEIVERYAQGDAARLPELARELVERGVDVLWSTGSVASRTAKEATAKVPIVMVSADAVGGGLVDSMSRPGGNLTGLTLIGTELVGKRVEMIRQLVPKVSRLTALGLGPGSEAVPFVASWLQLSRVAAASLRLDFEFAELTSDPDQWDREIGLLAGERGRVIALIESPFFLLNRVRLGELFLRHRLPTVFAFTEHVRAGGLISYGVSFRYIDERVAFYVSRILRGAKPGELPVEQPTRYELAINRSTARALGLTVPRSLLLRADEVVG